MALYKNRDLVKYSDHAAFDSKHKPGTKVPHSGIYRCTGCGDEYCCNEGDPFPPQNHHQHPNRNPIEWQLLVYSQVKK